MVVVLALIVFLWFRGFSEESVTKFGGTNIKLVCADVQFESSYDSGELYLSNIGNVPIYSFKLKIEGAGSSDLVDIEDATGTWPEAGLNLNGVFTGTVSVASGTQQINVIPVLRGTSDKGARSHTCDEQYGVIVSV
ncbi:MAG: hypothetical protein NTW17_03410 [Candidatus Pacearchaeota archaeon]|nr:hypothetical protein [Candidatus Pacearchaeota archaeon]